MSIISHKERGKEGKSSWRGNCGGNFYRDILGFICPKVFTDPCVGSGTSVEVAQSMGIESYGLDLHSGFNVLKDSITETVGKQSDFVLSHPPYHDMVKYSGKGNQWGDTIHPDDLSACKSHEDFLEKIHIMMLNQREATLPGGYYGTLIGDMRRQGKYYSYQADILARMPGSELRSVIIKGQHNCASSGRNYAKMKMPWITHEYLLLWQTPDVIQSVVKGLHEMAHQQHNRLRSTWRSVIKAAMIELGGKTSLPELYHAISINSPDKLLANQENWKAAARRTLQQHGDLFTRVERGVWQIAN